MNNICWSKMRLLITGMCAVVLFGCNLKQPLPTTVDELNCHQVKIAEGPEDFVLDSWHESSRLLISCHDRRRPESSGGIYYYELTTHKHGELRRSGEPDAIVSFKPHGMDIRKTADETLLYVIIHDPNNQMKRNENAIVIYTVFKEELKFVRLLEDQGMLWSPNDLSVLPSGDIYVTNDYRTMLDIYLRRNVSEISFYNNQLKKWSIVADDIAFANGIYAIQDKVFVTATLGNQVLCFPRKDDGSFGEPDIVAELKGPDNLIPHGEYLLTTAHFDDLAFMKHKKNPGAFSPSTVFLVHPEKKTLEPVYANDGQMISAASTAMVYENKLYISQVFDDHIAICNIPQYSRSLKMQ